MMRAGMTRAPAPRLVRLPRNEPTVFSLVRRSSRGELEARLAESARRRSPYFGARSLPLRFLAMNAIRMRWEMLRACIFCMIAALWCSAVLELMRNCCAMNLVGNPSRRRARTSRSRCVSRACRALNSLISCGSSRVSSVRDRASSTLASRASASNGFAQNGRPPPSSPTRLSARRRTPLS